MSLVKIQPYIIDETQNFTFANVTSTGNVTSNNANLGNLVYANFFIGFGNNLANIYGPNVSGIVPNANVANTAYSVAVGNVTGIGNIATINIDGNSSNILYGNGVFASAPVTYGNSNVASFLANYGSNTISSTGNITAANINSSFISVSGNSNVGNLNTGGIVSATGNVTGNYILGNGAFLTGVSTSSNTIFNGNSNVLVTANSNISMTVAGNANVVVITGTGANVSGYVNVTGNVLAGNANLGNAVTANFFIGSGNNLSNLILANISGIGNIASVNLDGSASNVLYGNGIFAPSTGSYGNSDVANFLANYGSNTISSTGNVSFSGANVSLGSVGNLHLTGGANGQVLSTDGAGNLTFTDTYYSEFYTDSFTGNGVQTSFTLSVTPINENVITVNYNGATVLKSDYTITGNTITFDSAPANSSQLEITTYQTSTGFLAGQGFRNYTGDNITVNYAVTSGMTVSSVLVTLDGIVQAPTTDYTISGSTLTFTTAPGSGVAIQIRETAVLQPISAGISTGKSIAMAIVFGF